MYLGISVELFFSQRDKKVFTYIALLKIIVFFCKIFIIIKAVHLGTKNSIFNDLNIIKFKV